MARPASTGISFPPRDKGLFLTIRMPCSSHLEASLIVNPGIHPGVLPWIAPRRVCPFPAYVASRRPRTPEIPSPAPIGPVRPFRLENDLPSEPGTGSVGPPTSLCSSKLQIGAVVRTKRVGSAASAPPQLRPFLAWKRSLRSRGENSSSHRGRIDSTTLRLPDRKLSLQLPKPCRCLG